MPKALTPLRYPGGKTKLYDYVLGLIKKNDLIGGTYIEPFAGGAGIAIRLLLDGHVSKIVLNDFDYAIYSIWKVILEHNEQLCDFIENVPLNTSEWQRQKSIYANQSEYTLLEIGMSAFYLNRTNVSGVLTGGVIGGLSQEGTYKIDARFNRHALIQRVKNISKHKENIDVYNWNGADFVLNILNDYENCFVYFDPPYVKKGPGLYRNSFSKDDHTCLSEVISACQFKWIVTYDNCPLIQELYQEFDTEVLSIKYSAGETKSGQELIIFNHNVEHI